MRLAAQVAVVGLCLGLLTAYSAGKAKPLQIYMVDVEGGQATLVVSPSGQSLLIDAGWLGFNGRDASRILAVAKLAGIRKIDVLVVTHYHRDHVGGVIQLSEQIPVRTFVDHGPNVQTWDTPAQDYAAYLKVAERAHHIVARPGDILPLKGVTVQVISSGGKLVTRPLAAGGQANEYCGSDAEPPEDPGKTLSRWEPCSPTESSGSSIWAISRERKNWHCSVQRIWWEQWICFLSPTTASQSRIQKRWSGRYIPAWRS